jgi:hypothetical protein
MVQRISGGARTPRWSPAGFAVFVGFAFLGSIVGTGFWHADGAEPRAPRQAETAVRDGRTVILVNGEPLQPMIYALTEGGRFTWEPTPHKNLQSFAQLGFRLYQIDVWFNDIWRADGRLDLDTPAKQIRGVLECCPQAAVFLRLHVNSPSWWNVKFPDECTGYADGPAATAPGGDDCDRGLRHSMASTKWRAEATERLVEFCRRLSAMPEGDAVVGLHIAGGVYGEWHYWGFAHQPDTGKAMTRRFREWLREKYGDDAALRAAWNDPQATLAAAEVPNLDQRRKTSDGVFRDPQKERRVIDYYRCQQEQVADNVIHFCRKAKENWPRRLMTGVFYGYYFGMFDMMAPGGHLEMGRVLNSPYVDYLSAPLSYEVWSRQVGGAGQARGIPKSCALHGKLWLNEVDHPTLLGDCFGRVPPFRPVTLADSIATMRRNAFTSFAEGMGFWWYDFGPKGAGGWWDHPALLAEVGKLKKTFEAAAKKPYASDADVLFVYDTECFYDLGGPEADPITNTIINLTSSDVRRSGVVTDRVLLMDLDRVDLKPYRVIVFADCLRLTEKQRTFISTKVACDGRHVVWLYAPGYCDGEKLDLGHVSQVTGMKLVRVEISGPPRIVVQADRFPAAKFGLDRPLRPIFAVQDREATALGRFEGGDFVGFARKKLPHHTAWYCALPPRDSALLRAMFREGSAHIFDDQDDAVNSGGGILCIHTEKGGPRKIVLRNGKVIETTLPPRSTTLFDNTTGETVLGN